MIAMENKWDNLVSPSNKFNLSCVDSLVQQSVQHILFLTRPSLAELRSRSR